MRHIGLCLLAAFMLAIPECALAQTGKVAYASLQPAGRCPNCVYIPANSEQGKEIRRKMERYWGVQLPSQVVGFLVPFPFNLIASTGVCTVLSVGHDAQEYREDNRQEPTQEQYGRSFSGNFIDCSPIGPLVNAKTPGQRIVAFFGIFLPFIKNVPQGVGYAQQGLSYVQVASANKPGVKGGPPKKHLAEAR